MSGFIHVGNEIEDFDLATKAARSTIVELDGYKGVNPSVAFNVLEFWKAVSTLYVTITDARDAVVARGTLNIQPLAWLSELSTLEADGQGIYARGKSVVRFPGY